MGSMGYACWAPSPQVGIGRSDVRDLNAMLVVFVVVVVEHYAEFGVKRRLGRGHLIVLDERLNRSSPSLKSLSERNTGVYNENLAALHCQFKKCDLVQLKFPQEAHMEIPSRMVSSREG
jgi:hypothetical protein